GWYDTGPGAQGAGFITATIGALLVLFIWNRLVARGAIPDWNK
ncbi:GlsB/YeaQ/YmgE family stress response membrane protein, partial [Acinetobacter baumannii]